MKNVLYLDDYINFYSSKLNKIIIYKPYKNTFWMGRIINKKKFIINFLKLKEINGLNNSILSEEIIIITNKLIKDEDKILLNEVMEELNYKKITFINELEIIKIEKDSLFIFFNYSYFYIYYVKEDGKIKLIFYENNELNKMLIKYILKMFNKNDIFISGKNYNELINIIKDKKLNYFYYENNNNLFIENLKIMYNDL